MDKNKKIQTEDEISVQDLLQTASTHIRPLERSFEVLNWTSHVAWTDMCRIMTHMDPGSSLIHATLNAFCLPYRDGLLYNQEISQIEFAHVFRKELAYSLSSDSGDGREYVELLGNGSWISMTSTDMDVLSDQLKTPSHEFDSVMIEHLSNVIEKDIFIIDAETEDIVIDSVELSTRYKNRLSIVILKVKEHYELLCLRRFCGEFITHFDPEHEWIKKLKTIINSKME
jgi:hypothetical protein